MKQRYFRIIYDCPLCEAIHARVAEVGWLSGSAKLSLRAFEERLFANFCDKNVVFLQWRKYQCNSIQKYSFTNCVLEVLSNEVGCHWDLENLSLGLPKCATIEQYRYFASQDAPEVVLSLTDTPLLITKT